MHANALATSMRVESSTKPTLKMRAEKAVVRTLEVGQPWATLVCICPFAGCYGSHELLYVCNTTHIQNIDQRWGTLLNDTLWHYVYQDGVLSFELIENEKLQKGWIYNLPIGLYFVCLLSSWIGPKEAITNSIDRDGSCLNISYEFKMWCKLLLQFFFLMSILCICAWKILKPCSFLYQFLL
jgi:hypothetical protein